MHASPAEIETLFHGALEQTTAEGRAQFIAAACGSDAVLRGRIDALIAAHLEGDAGFLEARFERPKFRRNGEQAGERIGNYELLEQLGAGAFGMVWRAKQTAPVRREVALKIIKLGMDTREVIARFDQERQALAILNHPNIARVFDAGATATGRPFFAMELVEGPRLTDFCDRANLSTPDRLRLFVQVCHGVQHAHQKGIIHRDLKPSNILVAGEAERAVPKIIDFGVAKATQEKLTELTLLTAYEQIIGTPHYLSPEQATPGALDIDTRSDIYSLGVLLFELLTGQLPFGKLTTAGVDELRRAIREQDPPRPSTALSSMDREGLLRCARQRGSEPPRLIGAIRGDLDWIVTRAIEKERDRRYATASAFAEDIERHLSCKPVHARPPGNVYRFRTFARRNKVALSAAAAVFVTLIAGTTVSTWQAVRAKTALSRLAESAPAFAQQAQRLAFEDRFPEAIEKIDYALQLRPDVAGYHVAKANLFQSQLRLAEARKSYRAALQIQPNEPHAKANLALCEKLLSSRANEDQRISREALTELFAAMISQQRPAAELRLVGRMLGEEKQFLLSYWRERLKELPIAPERPLEQRLTIGRDGLLALDLSQTGVVDLTPLIGMPLAELDCAECSRLSDLTPLRGLPLRRLILSKTEVYTLLALAGSSTLEELGIGKTKVINLEPLRGAPLKILDLALLEISDISALRGLSLEHLDLNGTRVTDLEPLSAMPLRRLILDSIPASDFDPLQGIPLRYLSLRFTKPNNLRFLEGMPLRELFFGSASVASHLESIPGIPTLEVLTLPPEIAPDKKPVHRLMTALRTYPSLRQVGMERDGERTNCLQPVAAFWQEWDAQATVIQRFHEIDEDIGVSIEVLPDRTWLLRAEEPANDGSYAPQRLEFLKNTPVTELRLSNLRMEDLSALNGLPLRLLSVQEIPIEDLRPLRGLPLEQLDLTKTNVTDLSPLKGLRLKRLCLEGTPVSDLAPLQGMPLEDLWLGHTMVRDLTPLRGMPLRILHTADSLVTDLSPLLHVPTLEHLRLPKGARNIDQLRALPRLKYLSFDFDPRARRPKHTVEEFWSADRPGSEEMLAREKRFSELERLLRLRLKNRSSTEESTDYAKLAAVVVAQGNLQAYREVCAEMRSRVKLEKVDPIVRVCTLAPDSGITADELRPLVHAMTVQQAPTWLTRAMGAYRLQEWKTAQADLEDLLRHAGVGAVSLAQGEALLAMVRCQQNDIGSAAGGLAKARQWIAAERARGQGRDGWYHLVNAELLTAEAGKLLAETARESGVPLPAVPTVQEFWNRSAAHEDELVRQQSFVEVERVVRARVELETSDEPDFDLLKLAALALARADQAAYRAVCANIRGRIQSTQDPASLLTAIVLAPNSGTPPEDVRLLAEACSGRFHRDDLRQWALFPGSVSAYRAGQFSEAEKLLRNLFPSRNLQPSVAAAGRAVRSMTRVQQKDFAAARAEYLEARHAVDAWKQSTEWSRAWGHWLVAELLMNEADKLINAEPAETAGE